MTAKTKIKKRFRPLADKHPGIAPQSIEEAVKILKQYNTTKFDQSIDIAVRLGVDPKQADQIVRGSVVLPHGIGKTLRVIVFAKGDQAEQAKEAGADEVGGEELAKKIKDGWTDFDACIAAPDMMGVVGPLGRVLGPRGLMPSPRAGTVTPEIAKTVREYKAGKVEFRTDASGHRSRGGGQAELRRGEAGRQHQGVHRSDPDHEAALGQGPLRQERRRQRHDEPLRADRSVGTDIETSDGLKQPPSGVATKTGSAMSKLVKDLLTNHLRSELEGVQELLLVSVVGLTANNTAALRRSLRDKNIKLLVIKNSLARRATEGTQLAPAFEGSDGTLAMIWGSTDIVSLAKEVVKLAGEKQYEAFRARGGVMGGTRLAAEEVDQISKWPTREEQISIIVGQMLSVGRQAGRTAQQCRRRAGGSDQADRGKGRRSGTRGGSSGGTRERDGRSGVGRPKRRRPRETLRPRVSSTARPRITNETTGVACGIAARAR